VKVTKIDLRACSISDLASLVTILVAIEVERTGLTEFRRLLVESGIDDKVKVTKEET
jgi:hypothetical protein